MIDVDGPAVLGYVHEVTVDDVGAQDQVSEELPLQAHIDVHRGRIVDLLGEYGGRRLFADLDLLHRRIGGRQAVTSPAPIAGRTAIKSCPVKRVGELRKSSGIPMGTPKMPGRGFAIELPVKFCRPTPGGPRATRSASMELVRP